jgi:hypothetical protein
LNSPFKNNVTLPWWRIRWPDRLAMKKALAGWAGSAFDRFRAIFYSGASTI